jgi:hypothetical protein
MDEQPQGRAGNLTALAQAAPELRGKTLTEAEKLLLENVSSGREADCSMLDDKGDDPKDAGQWTEKRQMRAQLLAWLCTNEQARKHIHPRGIQVYGADVTGKLDLSFVNVPFQLMLRHCRVREPINLSRAEISELDLQGSLVQGITADSLVVKNHVFLRNGFAAQGEVRLLGAQIGGALDCNSGTFTNEGGDALIADGINVNGGVYLQNGFAARGEVRLLGAQIGGGLECDGGTFANEGGDALSADRINVKGSVFLRSSKNAEGKDTPFSATGAVRIPGAHIDGQLDCSDAHFSNPKGEALRALRAVVKSAVFLRDGFSADGRVYLEGMEIGGELDCRNGNFQNATIDLTDATAGALKDSGMNTIDARSPADYAPTIWPPGDADGGKEKHYLFLDGFVYGRIASEGGIVVDKRLQWLERQPKSPFRMQPYLQLAKVLQEAGDTAGAVRVKERMQQLRFQQEPGLLAPVESLILRSTIGYGYDPLRALYWELGLGLVGWIIYRRSYLAGSVTPTDKDACTEFKKPGGTVPTYYPRFSPLVYSVENSLPLVKLGQGDKWQPDPERQIATRESRPATEFGYRATWGWMPGRLREGWRAIGEKLAASWERAPARLRDLVAKTTSPRFVMWFLWFQILLGWLLATLFVAGVSGVVHKE